MEKLFLITSLKLVILSILAMIIYFSFLKIKNPPKNISKAGFTILILFMITLYILYLLQMKYNFIHAFTAIFTLFSLVCLLILKVNKITSGKITLFFAFFIIIITSLGYNLYTPFWARQHDGRNFFAPEYGGHFGYIGYIYKNHSLPKESPIDTWCFYNPPFFYIISATIIRISEFFTNSIDTSFEFLQLLSFGYFIIFITYLYRILKELEINKSLIWSLLFVGLSPALLIMSGSINNDMLSISLSIMAIYYTIVWYKDDSLKTLIKIALTISLAIMTKISSALIAVAIAFVFLSKVIKNKNEFSKYIWHFTIFAVIALPIGLWFPIKNLVLYNVPFTYVQSVDESNSANISEYTILDRFLKINNSHLDSVNIDMSEENAEYNLYITTLKSFIIDEHVDYKQNKLLNIVIPTLLLVSIVVSISYLINIIYVLVNRKEFSNWIYFFLLIGILQIGSYISFCFNYPFTFTMNFRYIIPSLITYAVITGMSSDKNKKLYYLNTVTTIIFSLLSLIMFTNIV